MVQTMGRNVGYETHVNRALFLTVQNVEIRESTPSRSKLQQFMLLSNKSIFNIEEKCNFDIFSLNEVS